MVLLQLLRSDTFRSRMDFLSFLFFYLLKEPIDKALFHDFSHGQLDFSEIKIKLIKPLSLYVEKKVMKQINRPRTVSVTIEIVRKTCTYQIMALTAKVLQSNNRHNCLYTVCKLYFTMSRTKLSFPAYTIFWQNRKWNLTLSEEIRKNGRHFDNIVCCNKSVLKFTNIKCLDNIITMVQTNTKHFDVILWRKENVSYMCM